MLKITLRPDENGHTLLLEGRLAGPWVQELDRCWREEAGGGRLVVDLTGVTFVDPDGKRLLADMWKQGAQLIASGCLTKCIVDDIAKEAR
jgi:anti-anti-sigma regulatory factor